MEYIKAENTEIKRLYSSKLYRAGKIIQIISELKNTSGRKAAKRYFHNWCEQLRLKKKYSQNLKPYDKKYISNYFSDEKIAIYTCIIGQYDCVNEPGFIPNNCDFYIVTDQEIGIDSKWRKIDIGEYRELIVGLTNAEINRFFKMHPDILFPDYKYSVYLDGNIKPVSDLTEFVNLIGSIGIAAHKHSIRSDVFEEAEVIRYLKRDKPERIDRHIDFLKSTGMPRNYGLIECNVIAREHNNLICKKLMGEWWNEFLNYSKRDQISFVHVLFMNKIPVEEIGTLGENVYANPAIRKVGHSKS